MTDVNNFSLDKNVIKALTTTAATATVINTAEVFKIAPTKRDDDFILLIKNTSGANGSVTFSLEQGDFWASPSIPLTGTVVQGATALLRIESAKYLQGDGTLLLTVTPATGKILLTDHALEVGIIQI